MKFIPNLEQAESWLDDRCRCGSEYAKVIQAEMDRLRDQVKALKATGPDAEKNVKVNPARRKHPIFTAQIVEGKHERHRSS